VPIARGETAKSAKERAGAGVSIVSRLAWLLPAAVAGIAIVMRTRSLENADVSWLLTLAERPVDGHRDFIEVNPPGAIFAYMPAVWMARLLHIPVEAACDALVFLLAALCLTSAAAILGRRFAERHDMPLLAAASAAVLLILPAPMPSASASTCASSLFCRGPRPWPCGSTTVRRRDGCWSSPAWPAACRS
jgi:hypothetical protein